MRYEIKFICSDGSLVSKLPDDFLHTLPFFSNRLGTESEFALKADVPNQVSVNATLQDVRIYLTIRKEYNTMQLEEIAHRHKVDSQKELVAAAQEEAKRLAIQDVCERFNFFKIKGTVSLEDICSSRCGHDYVLGDDPTDQGSQYDITLSKHYNSWDWSRDHPRSYYRYCYQYWCEKLNPQPLPDSLLEKSLGKTSFAERNSEFVPTKFAVMPTAGSFLVADLLADHELIRYFLATQTNLSPSLFDLVNDELLSEIANEYMEKIFNVSSSATSSSWSSSSFSSFSIPDWTTLVRRFVNEHPLVARIIWETADLRKELVLKWFRISDRKQKRFMTAQFEQLVPMAEGRIRPDAHLGHGISKDVWTRLMADGELNRLYSRYNAALEKNGGVHSSSVGHERNLYNERNDEVLNALWNSIELRQTKLIAEYTAERQRTAPRGPINPRWYT